MAGWTTESASVAGRTPELAVVRGTGPDGGTSTAVERWVE